MAVSVAIVGAGRMGKNHAQNLARIAAAKIVGVSDVRLDAAQALAAEPGASPFSDYQEMLEQLKPDVVYLCTPAIDHATQIAFAAERGINIFVEKPLATTIEEAKAAVAAVEQHDVLCSVGYQWRYNPATDIAREALGDLPPTLLAGWWYWTIPLIEWIKDKRYGGGQVFDQDTHLIDLMRYFAGDITSVYAAYASNAVPQEELPNWDANALTFKFANAAVGSIHSTYALFPGIPNGNGIDVIARELLLRINLGTTTIFRRGQEPATTKAPAEWSIDHSFIPAIARNDRAAIRATVQDGLQSLAVTLAANYSATVGRIIDLPDFIATPPTDLPIMPNTRPDFA